MSDESGKQGGGAPPFSAQDAMEFMQRMWNPFAMPMPAPGGTPQAGDAGLAPETTPQPAGAGSAGMFAALMPGLLPFPNPAAMLAALDPVEVERKIGELRIIEGWLAMSLNMMQMSIKTLELQHASLQALHSGRAKGSAKEDAK